MKIGLVIYGSLQTVSGGYLYDRMLVSSLRARGHEVAVVSLERHPWFKALLNGLRTRLYGDFDVLLQDELCHPSLLMANSRPRAFPIVSVVHNLRASQASRFQSPIHTHVERWYLRSVDGFVFNSAATRDTVMPLLGKPRPHIVVTPGGDRLGDLDEEYVLERSKLEGRLRLLFLANVIPGKGLHILLDALELLPEGLCSLDVAGSLDFDPRYVHRVRDRAAKLGVPVHFRGPLEGEALRKQLQVSQLLVSPSEYEGFGIAILEAMAHGLPVIAAPAGAVPELVSEGENGTLVAREDVVTLAREIRSFAEDRAKLAAFGIRALDTYRRQPTWAQSMAALPPFLGQVAGTGS